MVVHQKNGKDGYNGRTEVYERIKLAKGAKETMPRSPIRGNRSKRNPKRDSSRAHRGYDQNLRPTQDVKLLPHDGRYSQHHSPIELDNRRRISITLATATCSELAHLRPVERDLLSFCTRGCLPHLLHALSHRVFELVNSLARHCRNRIELQLSTGSPLL